MIGSQVKKYKNRNLGDFHSIPISLVNVSSLDSLYLASHFKKLTTKPVATVRASKHYASTLAAWEKKLTGVDAEDLSRVAETLGYDVEVFNPVAASSKQRTLFSGGGSKRVAQLLKVKKGMYKPMKAGSLNRDTYEEGRAASNAAAAEFRADRSRKQEWIRVMRDENSTDEQIQDCILNDEIYMDTWNEVLNENDRQPSGTLIMRKRNIDLEVIDEKAVIPDILQKCELGRSDFEEEQTIDGTVYPKGWPECPITSNPVGSIGVEGKPEPKWVGKYYYVRNPSASGKILCYNLDSIDIHRRGDNTFQDPISRTQVVMFDWLLAALRRSEFASSKVQMAFSSPEERLIKAVEHNDVNLARELIRTIPNLDVNVKDEDQYWGQTPLHIASMYGHTRTEIVKALLTAPNIDVNIQNADGTPLYIASKGGYLEIVKALLAAPNIDVNNQDNYKQTPLHIASRNGHTEIVRALLQAPNIDVNIQDEDGYTPLHRASGNGHTAPRLRRARAPDPSGAHYTEIVRALLQAPNIDVNNQDNYEQTPLHIASRNGYLEIVRALLQAPNIDVNNQNADGSTPLHIASTNGYTEIVRALLQAPNIDVNIQDLGGDTPLHMDSRSGSTENEYTASTNGYTEIVRALLQAPNIDVNIQNDDGDTPLSLARERDKYRPFGPSGAAEIVLQLLEDAESRSREQDRARNVRQRIAGGDLALDSNIQLRGSRYGSVDDAALSRAIRVLYGKMGDLNMKSDLRRNLSSALL